MAGHVVLGGPSSLWRGAGRNLSGLRHSSSLSGEADLSLLVLTGLTGYSLSAACLGQLGTWLASRILGLQVGVLFSLGRNL